MAKETLISISERTGYSISTVSRALSGKGKKYRISDKAVEIIKAEAKKCNFTPSLVAQSLRTNKTRTIGLLVPAIDNPFFANIASVIITTARSQGYTVIIVDTLEMELDEQEGIKSLLSRNVDGILVASSGQTPDYLEQVNETSIPIVLIDRFFPNTSLPYVTTDNYKGAFEATSHLIEYGHSRIACIQGAPFLLPVKERTKGYLDALKAHGLGKNASIVGSNFSIQNGYLETKLALSQTVPPTAIFALSNTILLGAIKAINESALKIPRDISIVSFDDNIYLDYLNPPITRATQPVDEIGSLAIKILLQSIQSGQRIDTKIQLPSRLIFGNSVSRI